VCAATPRPAAGYFTTAKSREEYTGYACGRLAASGSTTAGIATIASGRRYRGHPRYRPGLDPAVVATLQGSAGTTTVHRCVVDTGANSFTIHLTADSTANVKVAWHVFG
jgi:hypothetical protein